MSKPYVTTWVETHLHVVLKGGNNDKPGTPAVLNLGYQGIGQWFMTEGHAWRGRHGCGSHNEEYTCRKVGFSMYCESVRR